MKRCLIYLDYDNIQNSIDLLGVAEKMYGEGQYLAWAVCLNQDGREAAGKFDHVIRIMDSRINGYDLLNLTGCIAALQETHTFDSILIPATQTGRMLAPRLSMRLHVGLVADVTAIGHHGDELEMVRPAFGGRIMAGIVNRGRVPVMMSVRQNVFSHEALEVKDTQYSDHHPAEVRPGQIELVGTKEKEPSQDIRDSEVLISGGGGVHGNFKDLEVLAEELGGQVAASRRVVDSGIASRRIQVGQSGKTVSPRLYIALGIYGSLQHIEGLRNVEHIISVNTNKDAPLSSLSDIVVEGDAVTFIEKLVQKIRSRR
jgi:electron transfer flavoprotein alpha subunit